MARQRDYAAEYARRQARARALGFESYYERRTRGRPGAEKPAPEELARRRGHRGTRDFVRSLREGDLILCDITGIEIRRRRRMVMQFKPDRRYKTGQRPIGKQRVTVDVYERIDKTVIPANGGREREYTLRRLTREELLETIEEEERRGVIFSPSPSMDQRRLLSARETEGGY